MDPRKRNLTENVVRTVSALQGSDNNQIPWKTLLSHDSYDEVMRSVVPVCTAVSVEISDSVRWNVEIQHQPLFKLPTITTDAPRRESAGSIRSDIHHYNNILDCIWLNN